MFDHYNPPDFAIEDGLLKADFDFGIPEDKHPEKWLEYFDQQRKAYKTKNILVLWGDDFSHQRADLTFKWLDEIIADIQMAMERNDRTGTSYNTLRSTMNNFFSSVFSEAQED